MARVVGRSEPEKRKTRGTKMLEAAVKQLQREAQEGKNDTQGYKTPPRKATSPKKKEPPALKRKLPHKRQFA
jgi:hypothetical protein